MLTDAEIAARYVKIRPYLDKRQRRLWLGVEAQALGRAGAGLVARATGADVKTVRRGRDEVEAGLEPDGRVRGPGGGRPSVTDLDGGVLPALEALVDPATRGDLMSPLRWTTKSTAHLAGELTGQGHAVTARTVASLLAGAGYSLQGNAKTVEGKQHPDRDAQFRYINAQVTAFQDDGSPVISVDAKKKENVGNFKNGGAEWAPAGQPERVSVHDFADEELGKAVPYGIYDLTANTGTAVREAARRGASATGIDPSASMLWLARRISVFRPAGRVIWAEGRAEALPLPDGAATIVWALSSAHHWDDQAAGLSEIRRVLGPGGKVLLAERLVQPGARGHAAHGLTRPQAGDLAQQMTAAGFANVHTEIRRAGRRTLIIIAGQRPTAAQARPGAH